MDKLHKTQWTDVGTTIASDLVVWPGDPQVKIEKIADLKKDGVNITRFSIGAHTGTHLDSPSHYLRNGATIDMIPPERLMGRANVFVIDELTITGELLVKHLIGPGDNVIFKTSNSNTLWHDQPFREEFVCLDETAAQYLADRKINLVGIDYLSIAPAHHGEKVHKILMKSNILILEGLMLQGLNAGIYDMICLPIKIKGSDGGPARVMMRKLM
jgi:arylformamidase